MRHQVPVEYVAVEAVQGKVGLQGQATSSQAATQLAVRGEELLIEGRHLLVEAEHFLAKAAKALLILAVSVGAAAIMWSLFFGILVGWVIAH